jgi:glycosyltransferase involved in cell wall biosynthesis
VHILLLSAYDAPSHRYWRQGLERYCKDYRFTQLALPARFFSWRIRGNSLSWAFTCRESLEQNFDLVLATSQVDLSSLRGMVPRLASVPTIVYFHENQFAYPTSGDQHGSVEPQMVNLYSALCADQLVFNSSWNRDSFLQGVRLLLRRLPDHVPAGMPELLADRAQVLPVPIDIGSPLPRRPAAVLQLVWNHRWEYDKGPAILLAAIRHCIEQALPVCFHLLGQQFKRRPPEFDQIEKLLAANPVAAGHWGRIEDRQCYLALLGRADVVLSTALHEFQGLAVMEAAARGCLPLVPDRLSYPEFFPDLCRYPSSPLHPDAEGRAIAAALSQLLVSARQADWPAIPAMDGYGWAGLGPRYQASMQQCIADGLRSDWQ